MRAWTSAALALLVAVAVVPARAQSGAAERRGTMHEGAPERRPAPPRGVAGAKYAIPLWGGSKHLVVRGTINGVLSGPMLVDTGASYCVLTRAVARQLGLVARSADSVPVATANGQVTADLVTLDSVQIDDARLAEVDAVVMDAVEPPLVGIIGLSFLNHFRYSVDHSEGTIQLER